METVVHMGEAHVSSTAGDTLACIGLGSCIGLALVDRRRGIAGVAHVMLPQATQPDPPLPHKYADLAVPSLLELMLAAGARRTRLEAALAGGAAMFQFSGGSGQEIGQRNIAAVTRMVEAVRIPVRAAETGGHSGRTLRVHVGADISITVREAGGREQQLLGGPAGRAGTDSKVVYA
jgi:chemotaxis protein CheD